MVISSWHALNSRQQFCIYYKLIFTARSEIANPQESVDVGINPLKNQDSFIDWLKDFKPYDGYQTALKFAQIFQNSINVPKSFCYKVEFLTPFLSPIKSILVFNSSHNFLKILAPSRSPGLGRNIPDLLLAPPPSTGLNIPYIIWLFEQIKILQVISSSNINSKHKKYCKL